VSEAIRTCAGCGRKAPKAELYRFVERAGVLVRGSGEDGRGVYTCKRLPCFERAAATRAFNRTLRRTVQVAPELTALYNRA
jgi:predicted RNA-binding protein YlxR (DUF448 family)